MMKKQNSFKSLFTIVFAFVIGGVVMLGILKWTPILNEAVSGNETIVNNKTQIYEKNSLAASVEKLYDAVMVVNGYKRDQLASTGTAFVYKKDAKYGYLLTNQHVVANMEKVKVGDTVFTIGTPMGNDYQGSVTSGILSGKDRAVSVSTSSYSNNDWVMQVLQIDASLNPGNSGGPLANANGEVIGVCSMKLVDDEIEGMGFAIPIEYAMSHVDALEKGKEIEWPVLGIEMQEASQGAFYQTKTEGVSVAKVVSGSAADKGGIKEGDIIIKLDDVEVSDVAHLRFELYKHKVGETITITVKRNNKEHNLKVTLTK